MGTLTLAEMQEEFLADLGNRSELTAAKQTRVLNLAQERLARLRDWQEMRVTVNSTLAYTGVPATDMFLPLPDASPYIREIYSVLLKDGTQTRKMRRILPRLWDKVIRDATANNFTNHPSIYTIWDWSVATAKAEIYPLPNQAYPIQWRITRWPVALVNSSDKSQFRFKDELIVKLATIYQLNQLGKEDESLKHQKLFRDLFVEALSTDSEDPDVEIPSGLEQVGSVTMDPWSPNYWQDPFQKEMP